jgi:methylphosphotriester-DNA--protein-cysteine methyltransferase
MDPTPGIKAKQTQNPKSIRRDSMSIVRRAFDFVDARIPVRTGPGEIAAALAVHPRTLNRAFQAVYGTNVRTALRMRQFQVAEALVADMKVDAAAAMMGVSRNAIYRLCRSQTDRTPGTRPPRGAGASHQEDASSLESAP